MMIKTTRDQRRAIKRIFDRTDLFVYDKDRPIVSAATACPNRYIGKPLTYRQFRAFVQPTFGMDGALVVPWCGMWLCIERDGYVHS